MSSPESPQNVEISAASNEEVDFGDVLREFEAEQAGAEGQDAALEGVIVSATEEAYVVDVGRKMEGLLRRDAAGLPPDLATGTQLKVNISGRTDDGSYYTLSMIRVEQPKDFTALQEAFDNKLVVAGRVTELVKGGLRVDVGAPAFLPASRSGIREMNELATLLGQTIECRITKLDVSNPDRPDVVVDRRQVMEEQAAAARLQALEGLQEGQIVEARVRSLTDFGAFLEILPGVDGLLHVTDMSWARVEKPASLLNVGQTLQVKILKINRPAKKIALGLKQLQPDPWTQAIERFKPGDRVTGKVVRLADFGAFVELLPGVDGLIHLSEMSWTKRVRTAADVLKVGEQVEAQVLEIKQDTKRISLGLKQVMGNPWELAAEKFAPGTTVEGPVTSLAQFGAFVDLGDGIEGMIHVADITREKRVQHPNEVLKEGQVVKAAVLEVDKGRKRIRLSMKQLEPTSADLFIAEHAEGETLMGRVVEAHASWAKIEVAEGVTARCKTKEEAGGSISGATAASADVVDLAAMLASKWKSGAGSSESDKGLKPGQIRKFRITTLDAANRRVEVELAE
ncbi:MAG: S1 RNA-binding domain-containing protein [Bryobacteraceae bacterium]|nr:S1 RNA-binding domain-containing protein [Solibacteraceae bacterium]MCO5349543.1 S1 RNA-binding domain-containing protein [Bryobacteraceae bacterium]